MAKLLLIFPVLNIYIVQSNQELFGRTNRRTVSVFTAGLRLISIPFGPSETGHPSHYVSRTVLPDLKIQARKEEFRALLALSPLCTFM